MIPLRIINDHLIIPYQKRLSPKICEGAFSGKFMSQYSFWNRLSEVHRLQEEQMSCGAAVTQSKSLVAI